MVKKINKPQKKEKSQMDLSSRMLKAKERLSLSKKNQDTKINTAIEFKLNEKLDKEYNKKYSTYIKEEFNCKIVTMFFNFITNSTKLPNSFKNNHYFLKEFLSIIVNLLINEIELATISKIIEDLDWIEEGSEPWSFIHNVCLYSKKLTSEKGFSNLIDILERNNKGFKDVYEKWENSNMNKLENTKLAQINEEFRKLMKPSFIEEKKKKFINYADIVEKIINMSNKKDDNDPLNSTNVPIPPPKMICKSILTDNMIQRGSSIISNNLFIYEKNSQIGAQNDGGIGNLSLSRNSSKNSGFNVNFDSFYNSPSHL